ncbi:hypothetical protein QUA43_30715 [Microcoleus sp. N9_B4]|uniref:hypothetical protein n=1 Tax=Microcoleus sp. N9_B4 TaxID=3055386 RepID=UPI002FD3AC75
MAHAAIFGFSPEEALADTHFQINMLTANYDELEDRYESAKREIIELRSQLATARGDQEKLEAELSDLKQKSAPSVEFPEAAELLNQLKADRKKSTASLADVESILEILEKS